MIGERPGVNRGHNCKTRVSNLHFSMGVTVALTSSTFRIKDFISHNFSSMGMMGKWSCYAMFQSDKKCQNFSREFFSVARQYLAVR